MAGALAPSSVDAFLRIALGWLEVFRFAFWFMKIFFTDEQYLKTRPADRAMLRAHGNRKGVRNYVAFHHVYASEILFAKLFSQERLGGMYKPASTPRKASYELGHST